MVSRQVISGVVLLGVLATAPAFAAEGQRRRGETERRGEGSQAQRDEGGRTERAVPRSRAGGRADAGGPRRDDARREQAQQAQQAREAQQAQAQRQYRGEQQQAQAQRQYRAEQQRAQVQRQYRSERQYDARRNEGVRRHYQRPHYLNRGGYGSRTFIVPRFVRPRFVTVVPYRPYFYRPSLSFGIYYGTGGSYPYGYTPRGYYDPIPGRAYGGLRITGASRAAQVFADGYYVGIVNDFDGVFQHLNLEAGPHQIEVREPGLEPIVFDVMIQPGRTLTFRAGEYDY